MLLDQSNVTENVTQHSIVALPSFLQAVLHNVA